MMIRKIALFLLFSLSVAAQAQETRYAFFSYQEVLNNMTDAQLAQQQLQKLRKQFDEEAKRSSLEFNEKYEEFLEGQHDFAPVIYKKRQAELQDMMDKNISFRQEAENHLSTTEETLMTPIKNRLNEAIRQLGSQHGYAFILNSDNNTLPYVDPSLCDDITQQLIQLLNTHAK